MLKSVSLLSIVQRCGVPIHRTGSYYLANCPFHHDKTPSLVIYPNTNSWVCFGRCQGRNGRHNGGGSIEFVKQFYNYSFGEAIQWIKNNFDYTFVQIEQPKRKIEYKPVPHPWVVYWHSLLGEHRQYFKDRGFTDQFINAEMWGWDGHRYCLPVWEGEPQKSEILGVRKRRSNETGLKYIGLKDMNPPTVWGRWYCREAKTILAFAGEFDAALAVQDNFPSFSLVNGVGVLDSFPDNWPELWFPNSSNLIAVFDRKEQVFAGKLAQSWNRIKGSMRARVFHWPLGNFKDYGEFRRQNTPKDFLLILKAQELNYEIANS